MTDDLSYKAIGCAMKVYNTLGPGLLESTYEQVLVYELKKSGLQVQSQVPIDIKYGELTIKDAYRADIIVNDELIIELKSVEEIKQVFYKQLLTYLKLTNRRVGLLINFNTSDFKQGIKRVVNK